MGSGLIADVWVVGHTVRTLKSDESQQTGLLPPTDSQPRNPSWPAHLSTPQSPFVENWGTFRLPVSGLGFAAIARSSRTDKVGKEIA